MKAERNSSFELLRLLCILGIVIMHAFARIDTHTSLLNTEVHVLANSLFNIGVTCFILISGYFGIKFRLEKLIRMDFMIIFFTVFSTIVLGDFGLKDLIKACIPVISRRYWFITCYFALCLLAPFLNQIPKHLEKSKFRNLLLVMLLLFSIIPTIFSYDIMQDAGKGLVHFVMIYLLGRYISIYQKASYCKKRLFLGFSASILFIFLLDSAKTLYHNVIYSSFARDCSVFIIFASVLLLLFFKELHFSSKFINRLAGNVLAITVLDSSLQTFFQHYIDLNTYADSPFLFFVVPVYAVFIAVIAICLNELRRFIFGHIELRLSEFLASAWYRIQNLSLDLSSKFASLFLKSN